MYSHSPYTFLLSHACMCRFIHCVSPKLCPKDKWLFIKYPGKTRELILAPYPSGWERGSETEGGRERRRREGYGGKEAKHPSAFNSVNWINAELCGRLQTCMCAVDFVCMCVDKHGCIMSDQLLFNINNPF